MFPSLTRYQTQVLSFLMFVTGAVVIISGGWANEGTRSVGITLMAGSIWFIMMSESIFLSKVQSEMTAALEKLRKKQESEIQDLLYFLRKSKISADPMSGWESATNFVEKIQFPAMTLSYNHKILKANKFMTDLLGWELGELDGVAAHRINDAFVMSTVAEICSKPPVSEKSAMHTKYIYLHKSGKRIPGLMCASNIVDHGFFVVFHPEEDNIINEDFIENLIQ